MDLLSSQYRHCLRSSGIGENCVRLVMLLYRESCGEWAEGVLKRQVMRLRIISGVRNHLKPVTGFRIFNAFGTSYLPWTLLGFPNGSSVDDAGENP